MAMTSRECLERWERINRVALDRIAAVRFLDDWDESFYAALRAALVAAGATDGEIDCIAQFVITWVVQTTEPSSEERLSQFELITEHLACTTVRIGLNKADAVLMVEFTDRPRPH